MSGLLGTVIAFILISGLAALLEGRGLGLLGRLWNPAGGRFGILPMVHALHNEVISTRKF